MKRLLRMVLACVVGLLISAALFGASAVRERRNPIREGCGPRLFTEPQYPSQVLFTGRVVYVGGRHEINDAPPNSGSWAVVKIDKRFWGVPRINPGFAVVTNGVFRSGQKYLISGPASGVKVFDWLLLTVDTGACAHSHLLETAEPDLRVLRDGRPTKGVRLLGYVRDAYGEPISHAAVVIESSELSAITNADSLGVYDVTVPFRPRYTIRPEKDNVLDRSFRARDAEAAPTLSEGAVWGRTVYVSDLSYVDQLTGEIHR